MSATANLESRPLCGELIDATRPGHLSQSYRYDGAGDRIGITDPVNARMTATFDALNRVTAHQIQRSLIYTYSFDPDGRRTTLMLGLDSVRAYGYDPTGRLTTQLDSYGGSSLMTQENTYDPAGNRTVQVVNGVPTTWTYDNDYRLIGQNTANGVATLSYDSVFNTTVMWNQGSAPITMTSDAASRLLTSNLGGVITSYVFDGAGNMISETTGSAATTYSYDGENRLLLTSYATGGPATMTYQGWDGLRRSLQSYTYGPTTFIWDGSNYMGEAN